MLFTLSYHTTGSARYSVNWHPFVTRPIQLCPKKTKKPSSVKVIAQILVLCGLTRWWFEPKMSLLPGKVSLYILNVTGFVKAISRQIFFLFKCSCEGFPALFPTHNLLQTWRWANLHVKNIDREKGRMFCMFTQASCAGVFVQPRHLKKTQRSHDNTVILEYISQGLHRVHQVLKSFCVRDFSGWVIFVHSPHVKAFLLCEVSSLMWKECEQICWQCC